jgi:transketolase
MSLPGLETCSGPLGEGLSQGIGIALSAKLDKKDYQVYVLTSDGEHEEGNIWEAAMFAGKNKLSNLTQVIDRNFIQIDGSTEDVMPLEPFKAKYEAFNWHAIEIDGNNIREFVDAIGQARSVSDKPTVIIADTIPGMGVSFMEKDCAWHGKSPNIEEAKKAIEELKAQQAKIEQE